MLPKDVSAAAPGLAETDAPALPARLLSPKGGRPPAVPLYLFYLH